MKPKPGKALEDLVAAIETILCAGGGFEVVRNHKLFYKRTPFAEFDIIVRGKAGSNPVLALIECRDRAKKAPNDWIHALGGKKAFHNFTSVAAVTTGGFAKGCEEVAAKFQIDLRTVSALKPDLVLPGLPNITANNFVHGIRLRRATVYFADGTSQAIKEMASAILSQPSIREGPHFVTPVLQARLGIWDCFWAHVRVRGRELKERWDAHREPVATEVNYGAPESLQMLTPAGAGVVSWIRFIYEIDTTFEGSGPTRVLTYASQTTGETISQTMEFEVDIPGVGLQPIRLHAVPTNGATTIGLSQGR